MFRVCTSIVLFSCSIFSLFANEELVNLPDRQRFQQEFDEKYFEINTGFEKLRHVLLHLVKTTGKMASYCESMEHGKKTDASQVIDEVLPDLLIHALQIANYYQVDLAEKYDERFNLS